MALTSLARRNEWISFLPNSGIDWRTKIRSPYPSEYNTDYAIYDYKGFSLLGDDAQTFNFSYNTGTGRFDFISSSDLYFNIGSDISPGKLVLRHQLKFDDLVETKIQFYSNSYAIEVAALTLKTRSDRYLWWGSDTNQDAMILDGNTGDLTIEGNLTAAGISLPGFQIYRIDRSGGYAIDDIISVPDFQTDSTLLIVDQRVYLRRTDGNINDYEFEEINNNEIKFHIEIESSIDYPIFLIYTPSV